MSLGLHRGGLRWALVASIVAASALSACGGGYGGYPAGYYDQRSDLSPAQAHREAARQAYERDLERRVAAALDADPRTKIYNLKVTSQGDGIVVISGSPADGIIGRDLALRRAARVPGVRRVSNSMTVN